MLQHRIRPPLVLVLAAKKEEEVIEDFKIHQKIIVVVIPTAPSPL
jgi:uncharacterized membrane protein